MTLPGWLRVSVLGMLALCGSSGQDQSQDKDRPSVSYEEQKTNLEKRVAALAAAFESAQWPADTPAEIGKRLGHLPAACLAFVRMRLRHEPYLGILRGSQAVLASGGGNSAELCVLLRDLIASSNRGTKLRFALADLSDDQARKLVDSATQRPAHRPVVLSAAQEGAPESGPRAESQIVSDRADLARRALSDAHADAARLEEVLGPAPQVGSDRDAAIRAAREHVWLQVEHAGRWESLDPVANLSPPADARVLDELPSNMNHAVALKLEVERLAEGHLSREVLFAREWSSSALHGRAIEVVVAPENLSIQKLLAAKRSTESLFEQLGSWSSFGVLVGLSGATLEPGKSFDLAGVTLAASPKAPLGVGGVDPFKRVGRGGPAAAKSEITGLFATFEAKSPGHPVRRVERAWLDRVGPGARARENPVIADSWRATDRVKLALVQRHLALATAGFVGPTRNAKEVLEAIVRRGCLSTALALEHGRWQGTVDSAFAALPELPGDLIDLNDSSLALAEASCAGSSMCHLARPNLYIRDEVLELSEHRTLLQGVLLDVALHEIAVHGAEGARARRLHGCLVSELEGRSESGSPASWAAQQVRVACQPGTGLRLLRTPADLATFATDADGMAQIAGEIARGMMVAVPASPLAGPGKPRVAYWRIDREGHVLAMGSDGRGQGAGEGMTVLKDISIPMVRRCLKFVACLNSAVASGATMNDAGARCLATAIRDIVKDSLDQAIDTFVKDPLKEKFESALGDEYAKIYKQAKDAWSKFKMAQAAIDDPTSAIPHFGEVSDAAKSAIGSGAEIGSAFGGKVFLLLVMGRDIARYATTR